MEENGIKKLVEKLQKVDEEKERTKGISFYIDEETNKILNKIAEERNVSKKHLYEESIKLFCERLEAIFEYE